MVLTFSERPFVFQPRSTETSKAKIYYFVGKKTFACAQQGGSSQLSKLAMNILVLECDEGSKGSTFAQHHPCPISQSNLVLLITKKKSMRQNHVRRGRFVVKNFVRQ
jgi:hypothetical protein